MTLYELCHNMTIQGNIEIKVFDPEGTEIETHIFPDEYDFNIVFTDLTELEDLPVTYIYPSKSYDGKVWLTIEVSKEDEE